MNDSPVAALTAALAALVAFATGMHSHAAMGAAAGCCFFLVFAPVMSLWRRILLLLFSFAFGYAAGIFFYGDKEEPAMLISIGCAAFASFVFPAISKMMQSDGKLPPWLESILDRVPVLRKGK